MATTGIRRSIGRLVLFLAFTWSAVCRAQAVIPPSGESDPNDHQPKLTLDAGGHTSGVYKLLLNGYGDQLISLGLDKSIRFWDVKTGEPLRVLHVPCGTGTHGWLYAGAISPDGSLLAVGGYRAMTPLYDHRILLISLPEGQLVRMLKGHVLPIYDLAFSPDGQRLASASLDATARIWNPQTGETIHELKGHTSVVRGVAWSPDGKRLLTGSLDRTGRIWSADTGAQLAVLNGQNAELNAVAWRPDNVSVATGCDDQRIRLFSPDGKLQYTSLPAPNEITSIAFSRDSHQLLYTYCGERTTAWGAGILDMVTGRERIRFGRHPNCVITSRLFPDGKTAVTGDAVSNIFMWDTTTGTVIHRLISKGLAAYGAGWSPDGGTIAWGNTNRISGDAPSPIERTFNLRTLDFGPAPNNSFYRGWKAIGPLEVQISSSARMARFTYNGRVTASYTLPQPFAHIKSSTLVGNNRAALGTESGVSILDCRTGQLVANLLDHGENVFALAVSGDQRYLLSAGGDQMMHISNLQANKMVLSVFVAGDEWIAWTPEGFYAASAAGESLMGWLINHGVDALPSYYPASRFHNSLYRPDIIRRVIDAGGGEPAAKQADAARAVEWRPLVINDVLPPKVTVVSPLNHTTVSEPNVEVQATARASGDEPVHSMRVFVDGRPGELKMVSKDSKATVRESWQVPLTPGEHQIVVKADTSASDSLSEPIGVTSSVQKTGRPALYVLGIDVRQGAAPPANDVGSDAQAIADGLQAYSKSIYEPVHARVLVGNDASRAKIGAGLKWLEDKCGADDLAVIFYRGASTSNEAGTLFLAAADTRADALDHTAIAERELTAAAQTIRGKALIWLDAAAPLAGGPNPAASLDHLVRELLRDDYGAAVMSLAGETAQPPAATTRGLLARALVDGLRGAADTNQDHLVHLNELEKFVSARVKAETQSRQRAIAGRAAMIRSMPLAAVAEK